MKKRILVLAAASAVAGIAAYTGAARAPGAGGVMPASAAAAEKDAPEKTTRRLIAYYFHGAYRCASCRKIEQWSQESLRESFAKELKSGRVQWKVVNVETKGNEHFAKDYKLYTKAVVLSDTRSGKQTRWKNLEKVWNLLADEKKFKGYIRDEVAAYLKDD